MTLTQLQQYIVGVLQGWVTNKSVLDKFSETADGKLLYNGVEVGSGGVFVTDAEVSQKIADTLTALGKDTYKFLTKESITKAKLNIDAEYDQYDVTFDEVNLAVVNQINVTATGLSKHKNANNVEGLWAGFAVIAPETAKGAKRIFQHGPISVSSLDNVAPGALMEYVSDTKSGVAFYANGLDENPKDNVAIQFFSDEECTVPITPIYKFEMILSITGK